MKPHSSQHSTLVWLRRDLRVFDHVALHQALSASAAVHCVFVYDTTILDTLPRRDRRVAFIHACIAEVADELRQLGGHLIVRHGDPAVEIPALAAELGVDAVYCNRDYEPRAIARDAAVAAALRQAGRRFHSCKDQVIFEQSEVLSQTGGVFSVFTPYKNAWLKKLEADPSVLAPYHIEPLAARLAPPPAGHRAAPPGLAQLGFEPADLAGAGLRPGMSGAAALFEAFLPRIAGYKQARDFPALDGASALSPHFRFGTLSVRHLVRTVVDLMARGAGGEGAPVWLAELVWREFYAMILFHHPHVAGAAFKPAYDAIAWESGAEADEAFAAWCEGRTGYPLVDAAMLELNRTGAMHNRLRMVTACFLIKDLGLDWRRGEAYFALHLNDFDLASNNGGWQWAASSGCDAQPYFRIFNPVTQSQKFDAKGTFIRRHLPQLRHLDDKEIHAPWTAARKPAGYPPPIVMHDEARKRTLERYEVVKKPPAAASGRE